MPPKSLAQPPGYNDVGKIFSRISSRYDLTNDVLSFGIHRTWKNKFIDIVSPQKNETILDLACGSGDLLLKLNSVNRSFGADLSFKMLEKLRDKNKKPVLCANGLQLPFSDLSFDKVIIGFGIRNISPLDQALREIYRILKNQSHFFVLEFSKPYISGFKQIYQFYLCHVLPMIGGWLSGNNEAYQYLASTIQTFPDKEHFLNELKKVGFQNCTMKPLSLGIATIYSAEKK